MAKVSMYMESELKQAGPVTVCTGVLKAESRPTKNGIAMLPSMALIDVKVTQVFTAVFLFAFFPSTTRRTITWTRGGGMLWWRG